MTDWGDMTGPEREHAYQQRTHRVRKIVAAVRQHRAEQCEGWPLCPGGDAAGEVNHIPHWEYPDFVMTLLAGLADRDETIDNLRQELAAAKNNTARAQAALKEASENAIQGWLAYRRMVDQYAPKIEDPWNPPRQT